MIQLQYAKSNQDAKVITEKLSNMSLAFKEVYTEEETITLTEGDDVIVGAESIVKYIDAIAGELHQWYYCNC